MKIFAGSADVAAARNTGPLAVAIGNFDGVHLGHQALLAAAKERAKARGARSAVLTFTPHPARLFAPAKAPRLIMTLDRRLALIADAGIDVAVVETFSPAFAAIEADAFVRDVLVGRLGACDAIVGYDFSFGRGRAGDPKRLGELGAAVGMGVQIIAPVAVEGRPCSSTRVRELIAAGFPNEAATLLGRPYEIEGVVVRGAGRGRALGFPTANVASEAELCPKLGIYAARAMVLDGPDAGLVRLAAVSIGHNPTFAPDGTGDAAAPVSIEAHLLDFQGDLYDRRLQLELGARLRDELRFESIEALVAQIERDVARVRELWSRS
jgi:riboflavin kinase / FMN adenylyltransferase